MEFYWCFAGVSLGCLKTLLKVGQLFAVFAGYELARRVGILDI